MYAGLTYQCHDTRVGAVGCGTVAPGKVTRGSASMPVLTRADCDAFRALPAKSVVEVQLVPHMYMEMKQRTSLWYKIAKAASVEHLLHDFNTTSF